MNAAANDRVPGRGAGLLIAYCAALDEQERPPVVDRLQRLLGPDLTHLLLLALVGDHRMGSRDLAA
jgi:hypothetical protein